MKFKFCVATWRITNQSNETEQIQGLKGGNRFCPPHSSPFDSYCAVLGHPMLSDSLRPHGLRPTRLLCPWDSPGKNTGVGCHLLLQETFLTRAQPTYPALAGGFFTTEPPEKPHIHIYMYVNKYKYIHLFGGWLPRICWLFTEKFT